MMSLNGHFIRRYCYSLASGIIDNLNQNNKRINADALITNVKNIAISVLTADCVPILIYEKNASDTYKIPSPRW